MNKKIIALLLLASNIAIAQEAGVEPFAQPFGEQEIPNKEKPLAPNISNQEEQQATTPHLNRDLADKILKPGIKNINYSLKILRDEKVIYDSAFSLLNSEIVPVIAIQDEITKKENSEDSTKSNMTEDIQGNATANELSKVKVSLIRVVVFLDKKNKNMWSNFFIENGQSNNNENGKFGILNRGEKSVQLLNTIKTPSTEYDKKEVLVSHTSGRNSEAILENYKFIFNGKLIK